MDTQMSAQNPTPNANPSRTTGTVTDTDTDTVSAATPVAVHSEPLPEMHGALLIDKHPGITSFGVIELLQRSLTAHHQIKRRDLPKLGHGGTLDPFATGLLAVCVGRAVKLARYFLGATKVYEGTFLFGETTVPGDPTSPVTERSDVLPESLEELRAMAAQLARQPYLQTPPMHSAKKKDGKPLYELARQGIEIEREPKLCHLHEFEITEYTKPRAKFRLVCSSGTYVRTLAQDFGRLLGTVALLETLERTATGVFLNRNAWTVEKIDAAVKEGRRWDELPCWMPFDRLLDGYERANATDDETTALFQGRQNVLFNILKRSEPARNMKDEDSLPIPPGHESCLAIFNREHLVAIARREDGVWGLERVFTPESG